MALTQEKFNLIWGEGHSFERIIIPEAEAFIERWEQYRANWYEDGIDKKGNPVYSIGLGHAEHGDNWPFTRADVDELTLAQARNICFQDMTVKARYIDKHLADIPLTTFQYGALVSLVYQQGQGRLDENPILFNVLKKQEYAVAIPYWLTYVRDSKWQHRDGLLGRRASEVGLYMTRKDKQ